jgi:DNA gyrase subunit A
VLATRHGLSIRFHEQDVREMGRDATGGKGIITINRTEKTGDAVSIMEVLPEDELMLMTKQGILIRMPVKGIRVAGRNTQGVKLVNLDDKDLVMAVARVVPEDDEESEGSETDAEPVGVDGDDGEG